MTRRILVAVEDSVTGLRTATVAVDLAADLGAELLALHVLPDGDVIAALTAGHGDVRVVAERRQASAGALLRHVAELARRAGVPVETEQTDGDPAARILEVARRWRADVIVVGGSEHGSEGPHFVGAEARHVLEFAETPVLVVPAARPDQPAGTRASRLRA